MKIKKAKIADIDDIFNLGNQVNEFKVSKDVVNFWPKEILKECLQNDAILVAEENKKIVGFIIVNYSSIFKKAIIENIFVSKKHRNKGIGKLLLKALLNDLHDRGCKYICSVIENNYEAGINFYLKNNFNKGIDCIWLDYILDKSFEETK